MQTTDFDWPGYIALMAQILDMPLDDARRAELEVQLRRINAMAQPLMDFELDQRQEVAGVYQL
ncbi:oxalurate catabolism protein HpxX [Mangrovibacter yixingensis]|uniref:oxalurate catabolism protein HpxX n=1 Tax=Mangrovibacter yixingensis TaxID=1529639 RepID=UPI001CFA253B|nr:oxalurate catabolism protein HpxX [Mangrovibacter yixingensis]